MQDKIRVAFVGFGFFGYPKELIESRCDKALEAVKSLGYEVVSSAPVFSIEEALRAVAELKSGAPFDAVVACIASWTETPNVTDVLREFLHLPICVWSLGGFTEDGRLVSPAAPAGATALRWPLEMMGAKFKLIYDAPDAPLGIEKVGDFLDVAGAARKLRDTRIGIMGYADMGLYTTMFDGASLRRQIGPEVESFDLYELDQKVQKVPEDKVQTVVAKMKQDWAMDGSADDETLGRLARVYLALEEKISERRYQALSLKCVCGMSAHYGLTPCMAQSMLGDRVNVVCECDVPGAVTQTMLNHLTGQPTTFLEIYEFWPDRVLMGVCGFAPFSFADGPINVKKSGWAGFSGLYNTTNMKTGKMTLARLASKGDKYYLHVTTGTAARPRKWEESGWAPPAPNFPSVEMILDGSQTHFEQNVMGQHYHVVYGDCKEKLKDLATLLGIEIIES
ncbi:MAG: hypothetical protein ACYC64_05915 [Armatimonadota bacterium]